MNWSMHSGKTACLVLNSPHARECITSLGNLFSWLITLIAKNVLFTTSLHLPAEMCETLNALGNIPSVIKTALPHEKRKDPVPSYTFKKTSMTGYHPL